MKSVLEQSRKVMGWKSHVSWVYISNLKKIPWKMRFLQPFFWDFPSHQRIQINNLPCSLFLGMVSSVCNTVCYKTVLIFLPPQTSWWQYTIPIYAPCQWYLHTYANQPCRFALMHPILWQTLLCFCNWLKSGWSLLSLGLTILMSIFPKNKLKCGLIWPQHTYSLSFGHLR